MNKKIICLIAAAVLMLCFTACTKSVNNSVTDDTTVTENRKNITDMQKVNLSGTVPDELEYIPDGYQNPESTAKKYNVEPGTEEYKGFLLIRHICNAVPSGMAVICLYAITVL